MKGDSRPHILLVRVANIVLGEVLDSCISAFYLEALRTIIFRRCAYIVEQACCKEEDLLDRVREVYR